MERQNQIQSLSKADNEIIDTTQIPAMVTTWDDAWMTNQRRVCKLDATVFVGSVTALI